MAEVAYMIPPLSQRQLDALNSENFQMMQFDENHTLVQEHELQEFLDILGMKIVEQNVSGYDGIFSITMEANDTPTTIPSAEDSRVIVIEDSQPINKQIIKALQNEVAPIMNQDIHVGCFTSTPPALSTPHGAFSIIYNGDVLSDLNVSNTDRETPEESWGASLKAARNILHPPALFANMFLPVYASDGKTILALLNEYYTALYLMIDVLWESDNKGITNHNTILFKHIIAGAIKLIHTKATLNGIRIDTSWCQGEQFHKIIPNPKDKIPHITREMEKCRQLITAHQRDIVDQSRRHEEYTAQLYGLEHSVEDYHEKFRKELAELEMFPKIKSLGTVNDVNGHPAIGVMTDVIYCQNPTTKKWHELGAFMITINFKGGEVRFHNITRRITTPAGRGMHAPHVFGDSHACFGSWNKTVPTVIAQNNIAQIVTMAITFLESVNTADQAGQYIDQWPEVSEETAMKAA